MKKYIWKLKNEFIEFFGYKVIYGALGIISSIIYYKVVNAPNWPTVVGIITSLFLFGDSKDNQKKSINLEKRVTQLETILKEREIPYPPSENI